MNYTIIIDAGTTNVRVSLLDHTWTVLASASDPSGVRYTALDGHNGRLKTAICDCLHTVMDNATVSSEAVSACYAYGMITSASGLVEIPHLTAPADIHAFRAGCVTRSLPDIAPFPITFIPGLRNSQEPATLSNLQTLDMMRGE